MTDTIPSSNTIETALDRLTRAGNFALNGAMLAPESSDPSKSMRVHIHAARSMLDEAARILDAAAAR